MISDNSGTKIKEHEHPRIASPKADRNILSGKLNTLEGPNMKRAIEAKINATNVNQCLGIIAVRQPTKGDEIAYVAQIRAK
jgi:hypothetical protein